MPSLSKDVKLGLRRLVRRPGFSLVVILTLALGIGANVAIFSVYNNVVLRPLPYEAPEDLVLAWSANLEEGWELTTLSYPDFEDWSAQVEGFEDFGVFSYWGATLTGVEHPRRLMGARISPELLRTLGTPPVLGSLFSAEETEAGNDRVVLLSHEVWQQSFDGRDGILGEAVQVNGEPYTVVGVMPPGFTFPPQLYYEAKPLPHPVDLWFPVDRWAREHGRGSRMFFAVGRLGGGAAPSRVEQELNTVASRLAREFPDTNRGWTVDVEPLHHHVTKHIRPALTLFGFAVLLVLLLACANVFNLLMAQATERQGEVAVQTVLGGRRRDLMRGRLVETLLVTLVAATVGLVVARLVTDLLLSLAVDQVPRLAGFELNGRVIAFTLAVALAIGVILAALLLLQVRRPRLAGILKEGGRTRSGGPRLRRLRQLIVAVETAVAVILLVGATQVLDSYRSLLAVDPGFEHRDVLTARLDLPQASYPDVERVLDFSDRVAERLERTPGVEAVAWGNNLPLGGSLNSGFQIPDRQPAGPGENLQAELRTVSPGYFETLGIPVVSGRVITARDDRRGVPVAVINEAMARRFWPDRNPVGLEVLIEPFPGSSRGALEVERVARIVGVVQDVHQAGPGREAGPTLYVPFLQDPVRDLALAVRTEERPRTVVAELRQAVWAVDPELPIDDIRTMEARLEGTLGQPRFRALLLGLFSAVALILAVTGIYSIVSYSASLRSHEIGVRISLGAQQRELVREVLLNGMRPVVAGVAAGVLGVLALSRVAESVVVDLSSADFSIVGSVALLVLMITLVANYVPARRLGKTDPVQALRYE